uniref:Uncharacterized protein n=1 Tax=Cacopsylla melanoneura TaxID=428564 RepID=A0A8D8ZCL2_9HEMI
MDTKYINQTYFISWHFSFYLIKSWREYRPGLSTLRRMFCNINSDGYARQCTVQLSWTVTCHTTLYNVYYHLIGKAWLNTWDIFTIYVGRMFVYFFFFLGL